MDTNSHVRWWMIAAALLCIGMGLLQFRLPQPTSEDSPLIEFTASRAWKHIQEIGKSPHPTGSIRQAQIRDLLLSELTFMSYAPEIQQAVGTNKRVGSAGKVENVLARLAGSNSQGAILLQAHYDSVADGPGATDNGSGAGTLLELARALRAGLQPRNDLIFLFSDGEEIGSLGVSAFIREHPWAAQVKLVINIDTARLTPTALVLAEPQNGWLINQYQAASPAPLASSAMNEIFTLLSSKLHLLDTDLSPWLAEQVPGYLLMTVYLYPQYHTALDRVEDVDLAAVQHMGDQALGIARQWGRLSLEPSSQPDAIYFNLLGAWLVVYPANWAGPLAGVTVLAWLMLVAHHLKLRRFRFADLLRSWLWLLVAIVGIALFGSLTWQLIAWLAPAARVPLISMHRYQDFWWLGGLAVMLTGVFMPFILAQRHRAKRTAGELAALGLWCLLLVLSTQFAVGLSYLLVWPIIFGLLRYAWLEWEPAGTMAGLWDVIFSALPVFWLVIPCLIIFFLAVGVIFVPALALLWALTLTGLLPWIDTIAGGQPGKTGLALATIGAALIGIGIYQSQFTPAQPQPVQLQYWADEDSGQAVWLMPVQEPVSNWVEPVTAADLILPGKDFQPPLGEMPIRIHPAARVDGMGLNIQTLSQVTSSGRQIELQIQSQSPVNAFQVWLPAGIGLQALQWDGKDLPVPAMAADLPPGTWLPLLYYAPGQAGAHLKIEIQSSQTVPIYVWGVAAGLPDLPETAAFREDSTLMPVSNVCVVSRLIQVSQP